jgi:hypothetical protein
VKTDDNAFLSHRVQGVPVTIKYLSADASVVPLINESVSNGVKRAGRWGHLSSPVTVVIYPDHTTLEAALHKEGYGWLKAWATEENIFLQSPRSWPVAFRKNVLDLMAHEMTHVIHYQTAGIRASRTRKNDPFWFREGLASYTAGQGYRRYSRRKVLKRIRSDRHFDPLAPGKEDVRDREKLAYSSAHHLMSYLIEQYGEERIRSILRRLSEGDSFRYAFETVYAFSLSRLRSDWEIWLEGPP